MIHIFLNSRYKILGCGFEVVVIFRCESIHMISESIHAVKVDIENQNDSITPGFNKKLLMIFKH